jgi:uncharacterized membrane protein
MNVILALIGALIGGAIWHVGGALTGGLIGWLAGSVHDVQQRYAATEKELAWLRKRLAEHLRESTAEVSPFTDTSSVATENLPDMIEWEEADLPRKDEPLPPGAPLAPLESPTFHKPPPRPVYERNAPEPPTPFEEWLRNLFSGENLLVKLGVVILFFGVSFLVKYAAQRGLFPIEMRLTGAALGGCALLATGWRLRNDRPVYAQVIQGGGIGILYLTTYATMHLFRLIPTAPGFAILVIICVLSAVLAVAQDSRPLAVMGSAGGFLAPELAGIGSGNPVMLFGFYAILNAGILVIARLRAWRELNLLGFGATFIVSALWGSRFYHPDHFITVEPFLVLFFLIYAVLPALYARLQPTAVEGYIDCTLVFGTPILAFAFQSNLVRHYEYGLAWSAVGVGTFYLILATKLFRGDPGRMRTLAEAFLALGMVFGTLAIPLAFDGRWTSAAWSIEGAALVWIGLRRNRRLARAFGYLLIIGSGIIFLGDCTAHRDIWPVLNSIYLGTLLVSGGALFTARLLGMNRNTLEEYEQFIEPLLFAWGAFWWFGGGLHEVSEHIVDDLTLGASLAFVALSCHVGSLLRIRLDWRLMDWPSRGLLPAMAGCALLQLLKGNNYPSAEGGWFGWPLALAAWYMILHGNRHRRPQLPALVHSGPFWLLTLLTAWEVSGRIMHHAPGMDTWAVCAWGVIPALMVMAITRYGENLPWPVAGNLATYRGEGSALLACAAWLWLLYVNLTQSGNPWPLPYLPLINPLDGSTLLVLISLVRWFRVTQTSLPDLPWRIPGKEATTALAATVFIWMNTLLLRSIHHWCAVPFTPHALFGSLTVQSSLSIFWCLLSLTLMTVATRRGMRHIWIVGANLLGVVVAKLFLVDLAGHGSVARIVSFIVVGLLILLIGWFSPVPPRASARGAS